MQLTEQHIKEIVSLAPREFKPLVEGTIGRLGKYLPPGKDPWADSDSESSSSTSKVLEVENKKMAGGGGESRKKQEGVNRTPPSSKATKESTRQVSEKKQGMISNSSYSSSKPKQKPTRQVPEKKQEKISSASSSKSKQGPTLQIPKPVFEPRVNATPSLPTNASVFEELDYEIFPIKTELYPWERSRVAAALQEAMSCDFFKVWPTYDGGSPPEKKEGISDGWEVIEEEEVEENWELVENEEGIDGEDDVIEAGWSSGSETDGEGKINWNEGGTNKGKGKGKEREGPKFVSANGEIVGEKVEKKKIVVDMEASVLFKRKLDHPAKRRKEELMKKWKEREERKREDHDTDEFLAGTTPFKPTLGIGNTNIKRRDEEDEEEKWDEVNLQSKVFTVARDVLHDGWREKPFKSKMRREAHGWITEAGEREREKQKALEIEKIEAKDREMFRPKARLVPGKEVNEHPQTSNNKTSTSNSHLPQSSKSNSNSKMKESLPPPPPVTSRPRRPSTILDHAREREKFLEQQGDRETERRLANTNALLNPTQVGLFQPGFSPPARTQNPVLIAQSSRVPGTSSSHRQSLGSMIANQQRDQAQKEKEKEEKKERGSEMGQGASSEGKKTEGRSHRRSFAETRVSKPTPPSVTSTSSEHRSSIQSPSASSTGSQPRVQGPREQPESSTSKREKNYKPTLFKDLMAQTSDSSSRPKVQGPRKQPKPQPPSQSQPQAQVKDKEEKDKWKVGISHKERMAAHWAAKEKAEKDKRIEEVFGKNREL